MFIILWMVIFCNSAEMNSAVVIRPDQDNLNDSPAPSAQVAVEEGNATKGPVVRLKKVGL